MRLGKILLALAVTAFALLLLSALVVYTPDAAVEAPPAPEPVRAVLLPLALPAADASATLERDACASRLNALVALFAAVCLPPAPAARDANGRVLGSRRYENCFYPVFRAEVAGG